MTTPCLSLTDNTQIFVNLNHLISMYLVRHLVFFYSQVTIYGETTTCKAGVWGTKHRERNLWSVLPVPSQGRERSELKNWSSTILSNSDIDNRIQSVSLCRKKSVSFSVGAWDSPLVKGGLSMLSSYFMKNSVWTFRLWRELACKDNK